MQSNSKHISKKKLKEVQLYISNMPP